MVSQNLPVPGWNAHRHPQDAIRQPSYSFRDVPKCTKNLEGSTIEEVSNRDQLKEVMAEMLLLCNEAVRRTNSTKCSSKPLSLEYIADRIDVDDPCFGYLVRSKEGMLQGFITVTTFTNWQSSFRWDSLHELAFYYDDTLDIDGDDHHDCKLPRRDRQVDRDGSLAHALQSTVRLGDPYNEGIVWPRIAEISLLGALGCGRILLSLMLEKLEFLKATTTTNYDFVVLQATDNSIPFYESMGFTRVGAVTENRESEQQDASVNDTLPQQLQLQQPTISSPSTRSPSPSCGSDATAPMAIPVEATSPHKPETLALPDGIVSSPLIVYEVKKPGEKPTNIAKEHNVKTWDIIFLNKDIYPDLAAGSRLMKGTMLYVPAPSKAKPNVDINTSPTEWFVAKENDTPRKIAKKFGLACNDIVKANIRRLPELQPSSRLKAGTRVKISRLDAEDDFAVPYCHWTFPDDAVVEGGEPSYMMAYKLVRKSSTRYERTVQNSLAVTISPYSPAPLLLPSNFNQETEKKPSRSNSSHRTPKSAPKPPDAPPTGFDIFKNQQRQSYPDLDKETGDGVGWIEQKWIDLSERKRERYNIIANEERKRYNQAYEEYEVEYSLWKEEHGDDEETSSDEDPVHKDVGLFSKVVKLKEHALTKSEYKYWFVLTYIPDLKWCHLAPMVQDGVFGPERKRSIGRPKWKLVDEKLNQEMDISSFFCIPIKSKTMKKTADADKEEWDIIDGPLQDEEIKSCMVPMHTAKSSSRPISKQPLRARSAIKPLGGKIALMKPKSSSSKIKSMSKKQSFPSISTPQSGSSCPVNTSSVIPTTDDVPKTPIVSLPRPLPVISSSDSTTNSSRKRRPSDDLLAESNASRKARTVNSAGARRTVLQD